MPDMIPIPPTKISDLDFYGSLADGYVLAWNDSIKKWHPITPPTGGGGGTGGGSVNSVGLSLPNIFTITNSPITTTGNLTAVFANQSANVALGTGTSVTSVPTFRKFDASIINSGIFGTNQIPNIFDQALNTINDVQFNNLKLTGILTATNASATLLALNILSTGHLIVDGSTAFNGGLNVSGGLIADFINGNGSAITHISETNVLNLSTDLLARPTSVTIISSGVLHTTPSTGIVNNGTVAVTLSLANQSANLVLRSGTGGLPSFSALGITDIPTLSSLYLTPSLTLSTTSPLTGGGNLSSNRTFAINIATGTQSGALSSTDWITFNNNVSTNRAINTTLPLTGGGNLSTDLTLAANIFIASGASHATGIVPDPGSNAGTTRFLCENATFLLPNGTDGHFTGSVNASWFIGSGTGLTGVALLAAANIFTANQSFGTNSLTAGFITATNTLSTFNSTKINGTVQATVYLPNVVSLGTVTSTISTDVSLGNDFIATFGGTNSITLANPTNPQGDMQRVTWRLKQSTNGANTLSLGASFRLGTDLTTVTLSTGSNKTDYLTAIYNNTDTKWDVVALIRGY